MTAEERGVVPSENDFLRPSVAVRQGGAHCKKPFGSRSICQ